MKKTHITLIAICAVLLALLVHVTKATLERQPPQPKSVGKSQESQATGLLPHGEIKDGLAAFLLSNRKRFKLGEPIPLIYGVINVGPGLEKSPEKGVFPEIKTMNVVRPIDPHNVSWLRVIGPDGAGVPYHGPAADYGGAPGPLVLLRYRQFFGRVFPNLCGNFELSKPGIYKVQWGYNSFFEGVPWTGRLMSNAIQVEIVK